MPSKSTEGTEPELAEERRPSRAGYYFSQLLKTLLYVCLVLIVFFLAVAWTIFITFTVAPIICWKRGYRKLLEYYSAPFELQGELFHSYRDALRVGTSEWDFEKGKPQPIALQPRGFKSVYPNVDAKSKSNSLLELPPEIRLQIYRYAILGDSTHVQITVHRRVRPGENRSSCIIHGHLSKRDLDESPLIGCKCFDLHQDGPRTPHRYRGPPLPCDVDAGKQPSRGILAISKTCRQMYMETIDLLYSKSFLICYRHIIAPSISEFCLFHKLTHSPSRSSNILFRLSYESTFFPPKYPSPTTRSDQTYPNMLHSKLNEKPLCKHTSTQPPLQA